MTHLNDFSKVYLEKIAESAVPGKPAEKLGAVTAIPKSEQDAAKERLLAKAKAKRAKMTEEIVDEAVKGQDTAMRKAAAAERKTGDKRLSSSAGKANADKMERDIKFYDKVTKKTKPSVVGMTHEALDPVGKEDKDIDNDGDHDKTDKYLLKRRKAIGKAIATRKEETEITEIHKQAHMPHEVPDKDLKKLVAKAVKRIDTDVDGDTDHNDKAKGELGEFIPGVGNKRLYSSVRPKVAKESFSNWRQDLTEIMSDEIDSKPIKEKKVKNKIKINPELKEAVEEIGGTLIEMVEIDEFDFVVESVYDELIEEGYSEDEVEFGIETALTTLDEGYYDSAVAASKAAAKTKGETPKVSMKDRLKSAAKKAIVGGARAAGKAVRAGVAAAAASGRAKRKASSIADKVKKAAKAGYATGRGPVEKKSNTAYRGAGVGRKEKIGEENVVSEASYEDISRKVDAERKAEAEKKDTRLRVTYADKKGNTPAYQKFKSGDKRYRYVGEETEIEEGIGMTMANAVGNPPALSKRMKLKQALLNREIKKNAAANKKKSYSGKAATNEEVEQIDEKALSKAQQRFMGAVYAAKKGATPASPEIAKAAASMTTKQAKDFAGTKHKGLPEKKEVKEGSTEAPMSPQELALQKRKTMIDQMIAKKRQQALQKQKQV